MYPVRCSVKGGAAPVLRAQTPSPIALPPSKHPVCLSRRGIIGGIIVHQ
jgi:hypothetical protein